MWVPSHKSMRARQRLLRPRYNFKISGMPMQVKADLWEKIFPSIRIIYFMAGSLSAESGFLRTHQTFSSGFDQA